MVSTRLNLLIYKNILFDIFVGITLKVSLALHTVLMYQIISLVLRGCVLKFVECGKQFLTKVLLNFKRFQSILYTRLFFNRQEYASELERNYKI